MAMENVTTIEICKDYLKFSAAHFTIFSVDRRERLHGHNFTVNIAVTVPVGASGMSFSYKEIKKRIKVLCNELDEYTLMPADSPYLKIKDDGLYYRINFNGEDMLFLKSDTVLLPIRNTTVEELSRYLLARLVEDKDFLEQYKVSKMILKVSSGPGQLASCCWER